MYAQFLHGPLTIMTVILSLLSGIIHTLLVSFHCYTQTTTTKKKHNKMLSKDKKRKKKCERISEDLLTYIGSYIVHYDHLVHA